MQYFKGKKVLVISKKKSTDKTCDEFVSQKKSIII